MKNILYDYLRKNDRAFQLFREIESMGDIYLIGGVLREYKDHRQIINLRDIDIALDTDNEELCDEKFKCFLPRKNRFGGYKMCVDGLVIDVWRLQDTWAYKNNLIECQRKDMAQKLETTVFLNIDGIVYDWKKEMWYEDVYKEAMESRILDIVLEDNPEVPLNIVRALILSKRYNMRYSMKLRDRIIEEVQNDSEIISTLYYISRKRYNREVLSEDAIKREIASLMG